MSKTVLIGLFLFTTMAVEISADVREGHRKDLLTHTISPLIQTVLTFQRPQELPAQSRSGNNTLQTLAWIGLGVILLTVPLYLLYTIRRRRSDSGRVESLQRQVRSLFHQAPCGYYSVDEEGVIVNINDTLLSWVESSRDEVVGRLRFGDLVDNDDGSEGARKGLAQTGKGRDKQKIHLRRSSGEPMAVIVQRCKFTDGGRTLFAVIDNQECHEAVERNKTLDQELESFSYSISHDLRAPLRSIDGYSRILQEDYASQLGEEGGRVLSVIMNNARRMGHLIDDLLEFGRLGRKPLQPVRLDMTALAKAVVKDLLPGTSEATAQIHVDTLLASTADADMMRQVWHNLLENAIKFSGKTENPVIEVRSSEIGLREICYEVKDNGVGFDMKYASKLYGVFQRLHRIQEFSGTGVGLAIVKRIISRHGGRVWAEGSPGHGAVFYFTIPKDRDDA